ncbi:hypothetical protein [Tuwongella immobilis]|uniref:Uncharacterized protein n=1 Tax=Tuwongella immobilis TaxID=692036 RepID=A0A6C2YHR2_9BACT|nr:hypothetical protein [Tuwongella immobilis]VIP00799.1 unnamed protein product [Tuwongella immobilis]VTR97016.1 unnamed protein product [Tuwongella immobilis]
MDETIEKWRSSLLQFVSTALSDFREQVSEQMEQFALDCHPWNGSIILAFLTTAEVQESPFLAEAEEMAAWKYYDFASVRSSSHPDVGQLMQDVYNQYDDKAVGAELFFKGCADVMASTAIQEALSKYNTSNSFTISVPHPDTGKEYYTESKS